MEKTIKTDIKGVEALTVFWGQYFPEVPVCSHPNCGRVAAEVDAFFPYIDDLNRCEAHPLVIIDSRKHLSQCGHVTRRNSSLRFGKGGCAGMVDHRGRIARITWRPPR